MIFKNLKNSYFYKQSKFYISLSCAVYSPEFLELDIFSTPKSLNFINTICVPTHTDKLRHSKVLDYSVSSVLSDVNYEYMSDSSASSLLYDSDAHYEVHYESSFLYDYDVHSEVHYKVHYNSSLLYDYAAHYEVHYEVHYESSFLYDYAAHSEVHYESSFLYDYSAHYEHKYNYSFLEFNLIDQSYDYLNTTLFDCIVSELNSIHGKSSIIDCVSSFLFYFSSTLLHRDSHDCVDIYESNNIDILVFSYYEFFFSTLFS
jgi:hypothetical protein